MDKYSIFKENYYQKNTFCSYPPLYIYIEPTNYCNLKCSHCPNSTLKRKKQFIDLELYKNIIKQSSKMNIEWAYLFFFGEPLLHPKIEEMVDIAHDKNIKVKIHTNGLIKKVLDLKIDVLGISLNETNVNKLIPVLDELIVRNKNFIIESIDKISEPIYLKYKSFIHNRQFLYLKKDIIIDNKIICCHPYKCLGILADGTCVPCCMDYEGDFKLGNINNDTLENIWNCSNMQLIRAAPVGICSNCNMKRLP